MNESPRNILGYKARQWQLNFPGTELHLWYFCIPECIDYHIFSMKLARVFYLLEFLNYKFDLRFRFRAIALENELILFDCARYNKIDAPSAYDLQTGCNLSYSSITQVYV